MQAPMPTGADLGSRSPFGQSTLFSRLPYEGREAQKRHVPDDTYMDDSVKRSTSMRLWGRGRIHLII